MPAVVKSAAVGLAWFVAYSLAVRYLVQPTAQKFGVPVLKDL